MPVTVTASASCSPPPPTSRPATAPSRPIFHHGLTAVVTIRHHARSCGRPSSSSGSRNVAGRSSCRRVVGERIGRPLRRDSGRIARMATPARRCRAGRRGPRLARDIDAITPLLLAQPFVDSSRVAIGGLLARRHPQHCLDRPPPHRRRAPRSISSAAGRLTRHWTATSINQNLFRRGVSLRSSIDPAVAARTILFYGLAHSRANFAAFKAAGGNGTFHEYAPPSGPQRHQIMPRQPCGLRRWKPIS